MAINQVLGHFGDYLLLHGLGGETDCVCCSYGEEWCDSVENCPGFLSLQRQAGDVIL